MRRPSRRGFLGLLAATVAAAAAPFPIARIGGRIATVFSRARATLIPQTAAIIEGLNLHVRAAGLPRCVIAKLLIGGVDFIRAPVKPGEPAYRRLGPFGPLVDPGQEIEVVLTTMDGEPLEGSYGFSVMAADPGFPPYDSPYVTRRILGSSWAGGEEAAPLPRQNWMDS